VKGNDPHGGRGRVCERDMARVRVGLEITGQNYCVVDGCLLSLSLCRSGRRFGTTYRCHLWGLRFQKDAFSPNTEFILGILWAVRSSCSVVSASRVDASGREVGVW
jgi:hypothetical protein